MAIKGKARRRARSRGGAPPRPAPVQRKTPLLQQARLRQGIVVLLSLAVIVGGLRIWENVSRRKSLDKYVTRLVAVAQTVAPYLGGAAPTSMDTESRNFGKGQVSVKQFVDDSAKWEQAFTKAKDQVTLITPPAEARVSKEEMIQALDDFAGVARLYNLAGQTRQVADSLDTRSQRKVEEKVQVILQHAGEWTSRTGALMRLSQQRLTDLQKQWHSKQQTTRLPGGQ